MAQAPDRKRAAVPASRVGRMLRFGMLSSEIALSTALGAARQLSAGKRPDLAAAVLTPGNAAVLAKRLAALRGPAMKVGQMLSIQADDLVPDEFRNALAMLRSQGYAMPDTQLRRVLGREYGKGWQDRFEHFDYNPVAAASIGQVHRARKHGGRELALKIQYPGVARSVDSDVENLATLLRRLDFLPTKFDIPALTAEAKRQLKLETDYEGEARQLEHYRKLVADVPGVLVPRVDRSLTTRHILAMDWVRSRGAMRSRAPCRNSCSASCSSSASCRPTRTSPTTCTCRRRSSSCCSTSVRWASTRRTSSTAIAASAAACCTTTRRRSARRSSTSATAIPTIRGRWWTTRSTSCGWCASHSRTAAPTTSRRRG